MGKLKISGKGILWQYFPKSRLVSNKTSKDSTGKFILSIQIFRVSYNP